MVNVTPLFGALGWKEGMGLLSVLLALLAFGIYGWQAIVGLARPHPLSWLLFGVLSGTGYLIQRDQNAGAGSWALFTMTILCLLLSGISIVKGERRFPWQEWAFLAVALVVFVFYLLENEPTTAAVLATAVDALGFGPTFSRGWAQPRKDSVTSFALNGVKFVPSLLAMETVSVATCIYPVSLIVLNAAVAVMLLVRRRISKDAELYSEM